MKQLITNMALALALSTFSTFAGDNVTLKHVLTFEGAKAAGDAAAAYARSERAPGVAIAVVDDAGHLVYFLRLEGTFAASANVSIGKARTAATFRKPTSDFETIFNKGRFTMTALPDFTPLQGGVPIVVDGHVVGAIGVSGAKSAQQDEEIANAGVAAVAQSKVVSK
jgi:glc operon protein GlcG